MGDSSFMPNNDPMEPMPQDDTMQNNAFQSDNMDNQYNNDPMTDEPTENNTDNNNELNNKPNSYEDIDDMNDMSDDNFDYNSDELESGKSAGVDPKKNIQKLAGRLSTNLNDYNQSREKPDSETNKFAVKMVLSQGVKGMDSDDIQDIIDELEKGQKIDLGNDNKKSKLDKEIDNEIDDEIDDITESVHYKRIEELFNQLTTDNDEEPLSVIPNEKTSYNNKPFIPKSFEK